VGRRDEGRLALLQLPIGSIRQWGHEKAPIRCADGRLTEAK
jgi:hypothetical protein